MKKFVETFNKNLIVGAKAFNKGDNVTYLKALDLNGKILSYFCKHGYAEIALSLEIPWYSLVKRIESEEHYYRSFSNHAEAMWALGRKNSLGPAINGNPNCISFILQNSVLLGHTEVMLVIMKQWRKFYPNIRLLCVGLTPSHPNLTNRLKQIGIQIITPPDDNKQILSRIHWLREVLAANDVGISIWVSVPVWVSYIYGYRVSAKQIFWSLKFHPIHMGQEVVHIGMTKKNNGIELINDKPWRAFQPPLIVTVSKHPKNDIENIRNKFGGAFIFATLAREEKFNSERFALTVAKILKRCPGSVYLFTGRNVSTIFEKILIEQGVSKQAHFIGWVNTDIFSEAIDCFLESFPFGCGVTGMQTLSHGTKMISLWDRDTLPSYYFEELFYADRFKPVWNVVNDEKKYEDVAVEFFSEWRDKLKIKVDHDIDFEILDESKFEKFYHLVYES
jgi:hypothetical protein